VGLVRNAVMAVVGVLEVSKREKCVGGAAHVVWGLQVVNGVSTILKRSVGFVAVVSVDGGLGDAVCGAQQAVLKMSLG